MLGFLKRARNAFVLSLAIMSVAPPAFSQGLGCKVPAHPNQVLSTNGLWTASQLSRAIKHAQVKLEKWMNDRSRHLQPGLIYGPNLDGTYFYRIGEHNPGENLALGSQLDAHRAALLSQGFPELQYEELTLINLTNNRARATGASHVRRCAKHFPGGDEDLERTEDESVAYMNFQQIIQFLQPFHLALQGKHPPECIMLGHALFPPEPFQGSEHVFLGPWIGKYPFKKVPASLNPEIVRFLKKHMNFQGTTIGDWYDMGAIRIFVEKLRTERGKLRGRSLTLMITYLATYAEVDQIPGLYLTDVKPVVQEALAHFPKKILADWIQTLKRQTVDFLDRSGFNVSPLTVENMTLGQLIKIRTMNSRNENDLKEMAQILGPSPADFLRTTFARAGDAWNRSGVLVMIQRQLVIEDLLGDRRTVLPGIEEKDETRWINQLNADPDFQLAYSSIPWKSNEVQNLFCQLRDETFGVSKMSTQQISFP